MMDSKQLALIYLMEESNHLSSVCTKNVHAINKKKTKTELEEQLGKLFSAMKEVVEEFNLDESTVMSYADKEVERRSKEK